MDPFLDWEEMVNVTNLALHLIVRREEFQKKIALEEYRQHQLELKYRLKRSVCPVNRFSWRPKTVPHLYFKFNSVKSK